MKKEKARKTVAAKVVKTGGRKAKKDVVEEAANEAIAFRDGYGSDPDDEIHRYGPHRSVICETEPRGYAHPGNRDPLKIVVDASEGFIPLWEKGQTLRWRFRESSMKVFKNPAAAKTVIRNLLGQALLAWGDAAPIKFAERNDAYDFEIVMKPHDQCDAEGCVLAEAFFPDAGRHKLYIWPKMFTQSQAEQVETLEHEIGHVFGLRHFFAKLSETGSPSEIFGEHHEVSIMNYGEKSHLTAADKADLKKLYKLAWSGALTEINGTPIHFVKTFHST